MLRNLALTAFFALLPLPGQAAPAEPVDGNVPKSTKNSKKQDAAKQRSLTGCVDQQDGRYVLTEEETLRPIAVLQAKSFPQEGFAKHVGHKVTVRGVLTSNGDGTVMHVHGIQKLSEKCTPSNGNSQ